jgi:flavin reductase (DIM6/NTAB) family NADH-FMN oxidoreductase RutF
MPDRAASAPLPAGPAPRAAHRAWGEAFTCDADDYRALMSAFPTGVVVVTSMGADGHPRGLTCSSLASVTVHPPTLLVCLNTRSGTLEALIGSRRFAVNLLHTDARWVAKLFAEPVPDRFARVAWAPSAREGMPRLVDDAFAFADCRVSQIFDVSDHAVVVGEVSDISYRTAVPLLYGMRRYSSWRDSEPEDDAGRGTTFDGASQQNGKPTDMATWRRDR